MSNQITRNASNFARMLDQVSGGMEIETVSSHELAQAARRCRSCGETARCEHWLDEAKPSSRQAPGFCPNTFGIWSRVTAE